MIRISLSFFLAAGLMLPTSADPCGFHNYVPQPTMVDRLLGSDEIVLARSAPDNPFRFQATKALEGSLGSQDIPFLVDSYTRQRLAVDPNAAVLFARDGEYGPWLRLAYVDAALAPVLSTVMERLPVWEFGDDVDRFGYFASLLGHPDNRVHKMALLELDQADYSILRTLALSVEPERLQARINDPSAVDVRAIRILLLGLSNDPHLRERLEMGVQSNVDSEGLYLGAYATALIELVGPGAVSEIAANYLTNREVSLWARELLIEAVAMHGGSGDTEMEAAISEALNTALWLDPRLAGAAARQFGSRGNWSLQPMLETVLEEQSALLEMTDRQDALQYLTFARESTLNP